MPGKRRVKEYRQSFHKKLFSYGFGLNWVSDGMGGWGRRYGIMYECKCTWMKTRMNCLSINTIISVIYIMLSWIMSHSLFYYHSGSWLWCRLVSACLWFWLNDVFALCTVKLLASITFSHNCRNFILILNYYDFLQRF